MVEEAQKMKTPKEDLDEEKKQIEHLILIYLTHVFFPMIYLIGVFFSTKKLKLMKMKMKKEDQDKKEKEVEKKEEGLPSNETKEIELEMQSDLVVPLLQLKDKTTKPFPLLLPFTLLVLFLFDFFFPS